MPKKEVFLKQEIIDYITNNYKGKYSEFIRTAVEEKYEKELENMYIEKCIEHLQEMGKMIIKEGDNIKEIQKELRTRGYETKFESTDRDYLVKI